MTEGDSIGDREMATDEDCVVKGDCVGEGDPLAEAKIVVDRDDVSEGIYRIIQESDL